MTTVEPSYSAPLDKRGKRRTAVITEGVGDIATLVGPVSDGDSPSFGVGIFILDVLRDLATLKPPQRDLSVVPKHSDDTTAGLVERAPSASLEIRNGAAGVVTVRALAFETKGISEVTLGLRAILVPVPSCGVGV